ncbi:MAG TPA: IS630 family transposase [Sphingobacteriaceae bacterium]
MKKNAEAVTTFRATFGNRVQAVIPARTTQAVVVWAMDESRLGLHTIRRRRITARGTQPVGTYQHAYSNFYLYGAIAPRTGDAYFLGLPTLNAAHFQRFLDDFAQAHPHTLNVLLVDNSRAHTAAALQLPPNIKLLFQPPYAPELNPAERVWRALKDALAWRCFTDLAALQAHVVQVVEAWTAGMLQSLTAYPFIIEALNALSL